MSVIRSECGDRLLVGLQNMRFALWLPACLPLPFHHPYAPYICSPTIALHNRVPLCPPLLAFCANTVCLSVHCRLWPPPPLLLPRLAARTERNIHSWSSAWSIRSHSGSGEGAAVLEA